MSDTPERIWVWAYRNENDTSEGMGEWYTDDVGLDGNETEYVRADIHTALETKLAVALDDAPDARIRRAIETIADALRKGAIRVDWEWVFEDTVKDLKG